MTTATGAEARAGDRAAKLHIHMTQQSPSPEFATLHGRAAVVTGSSSGLGRAIALELAAAGADVLVHARRSRADSEEVVRRIHEQGCRADIVMADLAEPMGRAELVEQAWKWRPDVGIWVNNAGGDILTGEAVQWTFQQKLEYLWRVDVAGTVDLGRMVGQRMRQSHTSDSPGVILNMGWDQSEHGMAGDSGELFATVKGAIMAFTRSLARTLAPRVRVNCLAPGWIKTGWGEHASEYWQQRAQRESLLGRWGTPEDVARVARFLASPAADYITGQIVAVNGGYRCGE